MPDSTTDFRGKRALVTGASRGIGRAIAIALGRSGVEVAVNYRTQQPAAEQTVESIAQAGGRAWAVQADVSAGAEVRRMFETVGARFDDRLDYLINNAGEVQRVTLEEMTEDDWDRCMAVNLKSVFLCTQAAAPLLPDRSGRIVNVSSISARTGGSPAAPHYGAAKAGVSNFTRVCAKSFAARGITVNAIAPGVIDTDIHRLGTPPEELRKLQEKIPLGRLGSGEDCAGVVLLLCSLHGDYLTGEVIEINGGLLMD